MAIIGVFTGGFIEGRTGATTMATTITVLTIITAIATIIIVATGDMEPRCRTSGSTVPSR